MTPPLGPFSLDRAFAAVERVRGRLLRTAAALHGAGVPHAIIGGHAVALWVSRIDAGAVRNTQNVEVLMRRRDFDAARAALEGAGFIHQTIAGQEVFLDGTRSGPRDAVHVVFANEKIGPHEVVASPDVAESVDSPEFRVISLDALLRIKLTAFRDKDRTHIRDLIEVGLVTEESMALLPAALAERLRELLDTPGG